MMFNLLVHKMFVFFIVIRFLSEILFVSPVHLSSSISKRIFKNRHQAPTFFVEESDNFIFGGEG